MIWRTIPGLEWADSLSEFGRLQREINDLFSEFRHYPREYPAVSAKANNDEVLVAAEVPGVDPAGLNLTVTGNALTIEGERKPLELSENEVFHRRERGAGRFVRTIRLPYEVEAEKIEAKARNGVLTIRLPRRESTKPRRIAVSS